MGRRRAGFTALAALALIVAPAAARAQESLEVQPPAPQSQPSFRPRPAPTARPPLPASMLPTQPILPAIFRGCWDGRVEFLDSIEGMPGAPRVGVWTPKTYR